MFLSKRLLNISALSKRLPILSARSMGGGSHDDHHHGPNLPPFARQAPPSRKLPMEVENVWDDNVAPESAIDFDAPGVPLSQALKNFSIAFGLIYALYLYCAWSDPETNSPVVPRNEIYDNVRFQLDFGLLSKTEYDELVGASTEAHDDDDE